MTYNKHFNRMLHIKPRSMEHLKASFVNTKTNAFKISLVILAAADGTVPMGTERFNRTSSGNGEVLLNELHVEAT